MYRTVPYCTSAERENGVLRKKVECGFCGDVVVGVLLTVKGRPACRSCYHEVALGDTQGAIASILCEAQNDKSDLPDSILERFTNRDGGIR